MKTIAKNVLLMCVGLTGAGATVAGCGVTTPEDEGDPGVIASFEETVTPPDFTDPRGRRWRARTAVRPVADPAAGLDSVVDRNKVVDRRALTLEQYAEAIRPMTVIDGWEYELAEPDLELARAIRDGGIQGSVAPSEGLPRTELEAEVVSEVNSIVLGGDGRVKQDNLAYPARTAVALTTSSGALCSAQLIGPSTAISAAHCFHSGSGWYATRTWAPGADATDANPAPFGRKAGCYWVTITGSWANGSHAVADDYAVIEFGAPWTSCDNHPGNTVGWLGLAAASSSQIESHGGGLIGYPGDKTPAPQPWGMWVNAGQLTTSTWYPDRVFYSIDTFGGQSGSGVYQLLFNQTDRYVTAIHNGNFDSDENQGRQVDSEVMAFIKSNSAL
jgi:V8-like Glu-specific endopeptidase